MTYSIHLLFIFCIISVVADKSYAWAGSGGGGGRGGGHINKESIPQTSHTMHWQLRFPQAIHLNTERAHK